MSAKETLQSIIKDFDLAKFETFFREKNNLLNFPSKPTGFVDDNFTDGIKLAEGDLEDGKLIVYAFKSVKGLSERSSKKDQYTLGKKVLRCEQADSGIFIFYDDEGKFRFSLIYTNYSGKHRDFSTFKRFTYFVSKEQTNKTFLKQIGDGDLSTIEKIKEAFSVDKVTKEFYTEIANWYFWAMDKVKFPEDHKYSDDPKKNKELRQSTNLIRLITRIIFIWFLKERDLIPDDLFSKTKLKTIVKDFMKNKSTSNFYNAILQNLFFATLNQKMGERDFAEDKGYPENRNTYGVKNLFRYESKFLISEEEALGLFKDVPFLNGGLFDCLDKIDGEYIDGFSRNPAKQAVIPDYLFFEDKEQKVDLSSYGIGSNKTVRGLIEILNSYNFTIDENTPIDKEVALDPELLGKVFENLLASYNPETATTARKATGSYYTPREIVDYMVETSLLECLKERLPNIPEDKLKLLLSYSDDVPEFSEAEKQLIISVIDEIKVIDPACGSGAFPMGILQRLVYILQKLDPANKHWYELQFNKAVNDSQEVFKQTDKDEREEKLKEINEVFDDSINYPDYSRKLYLIENCIYGVDIQAIAIQISKLRFFISLVIDQRIDKTRENFGIRPLPNLETKFVAANTLIGLDEVQYLSNTDEVKKLEKDIKDVRSEYFYAKTRREKLNYQKKDKELRGLLAKILNNLGFSEGSSEKIASFDLFDQNASAGWFDPEWMFGIKDGFDIVIGNPPYGVKISEKEKEYFLKRYRSAKTIPGVQRGSLDTFSLFIEKGFEILKKLGYLIYIVPISVTSSESMTALHNLLEENCGEIRISSFAVRPQPIFENSVVDVSILSFVKTFTPANRIMCTKLYRKSEKTSINDILGNLQFIDCKKYKLVGRYPKISLQVEANILEKLFSIKTKVGDLIKEQGKPIYYRAAGGRYFKVITNFSTESSAEKVLYFDPKIANSIGALLSSNLFFWYYQVFSDNHNLKLYEIGSFPVPLDKLTDENIQKLETLYSNYLNDIERNVRVRISIRYSNVDSFKEYKIAKSKRYIDLIDDFIDPLYGLDKEEIEFIKNYEINFRLSENEQDD